MALMSLIVCEHAFMHIFYIFVFLLLRQQAEFSILKAKAASSDFWQKVTQMQLYSKSVISNGCQTLAVEIEQDQMLHPSNTKSNTDLCFSCGLGHYTFCLSLQKK